MTEFTRRSACRIAAALVSGVALAGCSSSSDSSGALTPGESVDLNGLTVAYTDYEVPDAVSPVTTTATPGEGGGPPANGTETTDDAGSDPTTVTATGGGSILGVEFRVENGADAPRTAPMPLPAPQTAMGELSVSIERAQADEPPPIQVGPRVRTDGTTVDSLSHRLGQYRAELPPGETVTGWAFFSLPAGTELSDVRVVLSGTDVELAAGASRIEWYLLAP